MAGLNLGNQPGGRSYIPPHLRNRPSGPPPMNGAPADGPVPNGAPAGAPAPVNGLGQSAWAAT